jgi:hypothetical protein
MVEGSTAQARAVRRAPLRASPWFIIGITRIGDAMKTFQHSMRLALLLPTVLRATTTVEAGVWDPKVEAVLEAALRQQLKVWLDTTARANGTVVCLAIDAGDAPQSVDRQYLSRFQAEAAVRRAAECEARPRGAVERVTLKPAILITAGPVEWIAEDDAWVTVTHFKTRVESGVRTYRVVRERDGWISLGQIIKLSPG